jgi:two-component system NtrC family sensor kinase
MSSRSSAPKVLIVDDTPGSAKSLKLVLSAEGHDVDCAATAQEALTMASNCEYEAALIDISLPDQSGIDLLPELRQLLPSVVAIVVTGYASMDSSIAALNRGASGYVRKPVDVQHLLSLLRTSLEKRKLEQEKQMMLRRLSLLHAVAATVSAGLEPRETLAETLALVTSLLDLPGGAIWWSGRENQDLSLAAEVGLSEELLERLTAGARRLATEELAAEHRAGQPWFELELENATDGANWRLRVVPLQGQTESVGWMAVGGPGAQTDEGDDPDFLGAVAGQLGVAMDNMRLYDDLRGAYHQLKATQAQVVRSEKLSALSRAISGVAHELNNPLSAILGYCEVLSKNGVREEALPVVERVSDQAHRCAKIVRELTAFARPEEMPATAVDIHEVLSSALLAAEQHRGRDTEVIRHLGQSVPQTMGDPAALVQALTNVIVNAYQAMGNGEGALTIETSTQDGQIVIAISDTGPGIPADILPRVFDPFFTTKGVNEGTGLGLSVCHGVAREHGGELTADNRAGGGALFRMRLPIRPPSERPDLHAVPNPDDVEYAPWLQ